MTNTQKLENLIAEFESNGGRVVMDSDISFEYDDLYVIVSADRTEWHNHEDDYQSERGSWAARLAAYNARSHQAFTDAYPSIDEMVGTAQQVLAESLNEA